MLCGKTEGHESCIYNLNSLEVGHDKKYNSLCVFIYKLKPLQQKENNKY